MSNLEEPDKGFAWVVAVSCFFINYILSGHYRTVGVLYKQVLIHYEVSREEATLPFAVMNAVKCLAGPFVGVAGQRFGVRGVTFWGGLIGSIGVALCFVAPNITWVTVFWGGIYGLGCSLGNTLFRASVTEYFVKYRATAAGISISGGCVGSMTLPFLIQFLMQKYTLSGAFLFMAGIILHVLPFSLVLRAPLWIRDPELYEDLVDQLADQNKIYPLKSATRLTSRMILHRTDIFAMDGFSNSPVEQMKLMTFSRKHPWQLKKVRSIEHLLPLSEDSMSTVNTRRSINDSLCLTGSLPIMKQQPSIFNRVSTFLLGSHKTHIQRTTSSESSEPEVSSPRELSLTQSMKTLILLYKNPMYFIICISTTSYQIIFVILLQTVIDYSCDKGISLLHAIYLLTALSIGDLIGRMCFGWVTDKKYLSEANFMMILYVLQGVTMALFPVTSHFNSFLANLLIYAMATGSSMVLFPILLYKFVPHDVQNLAIGGAGFIAGVLNFAVPVMIGYYRDTLGSYDQMFILLGIVNIVVGLLFLVVPLCLSLCYDNKELEDLFGAENMDNI